MVDDSLALDQSLVDLKEIHHQTNADLKDCKDMCSDIKVMLRNMLARLQGIKDSEGVDMIQKIQDEDVPPAFTCVVEMVSKTECRVHHKLEATVDAILEGKSPLVEVCNMSPKAIDSSTKSEKYDKELSITSENDDISELRASEDTVDNITGSNTKKGSRNSAVPRSSPVCLYTYKVLEADPLQVTKVMGLKIDIYVINDISPADAILALSSEMKQNPWIRSVAKYHKLPVFVIKENKMEHPSQ